LLLLLLFVLLFCGVSCVVGFGDRVDATWPYFSTIPLTTSAAKGSGWSPYESSCGTFGTRWWYNNDAQLLIMYTNTGVIAGVQVGVTSVPSAPIIPPWEKQPNNLWTTTLFFSNPAKVCASEYETFVPTKLSDVADRLSLRLGNTGRYEDQPLIESDVKAPWVKSKCFISMGLHYWYNISANMDCDYFYPIGLMYNNGKLVTFLVNIGVGPAQTSPRFEHPDASSLKLFFKPETLPQCLLRPGLNVSTIHFFVTLPGYNLCLAEDNAEIAKPITIDRKELEN